MARIREVSDINATPEQHKVLETDQTQYGQVFNTTRIYAHFPAILPHLQALHAALAAGTLASKLVSLARLRVAQMNDCPF
jgi:alkylhydroperoxidase family enzyme